jgi:hypothetical protein
MIRKFFAILALATALVAVVPTMAEAAPQKDVVHSNPSVFLVDDDGVTREFYVIYDYKAATRTSPATTTCTYALNGSQTPNPNDGSLPVIEGAYRAPGSPAPITNRDQAIAYCVSVFNQRQHPTGDPTPAI